MDYEKFMSEYNKNHKCCPKCGSDNIYHTDLAYNFNPEHPETYIDENSAVCIKCSWSGIIHNLVSKK